MTIGQVVFERGDYQEIVETEQNGVCLVNCCQPGRPLYRVEWTEDGHFAHQAFHDEEEARAWFEIRAAISEEGRVS